MEPPVMIFVQTVERAKELFHELVYEGIKVDTIHAERSKQERDQAVLDFRQGRSWFLITTDLMARGIRISLSTLPVFLLPFFYVILFLF